MEVFKKYDEINKTNFLNEDFDNLEEFQNEDLEFEDKIFNSDIAKIPFGKEGLNILINSEFISYVNKLQQRDYKEYKQANSPLKNRVEDLSFSQRDDNYKDLIYNKYKTNFIAFRQTIKSIACGKLKNIDRLLMIVSSFLEIIIKDKSMIFNLVFSNCNYGEYIYRHSLHVCLISMGFSISLGYEEKEVLEIGISALLSDLGMLFISDEIRHKNEMLNTKEWYEIKKHPLLTVEICKKITNIPKSVLFVALQMHEKINGKGYPQGKNIVLHHYTKIIQIVDIYDSLISDRPYRNAYSPFEAIEILLKLANNGTFEKTIIVRFVQYISIFPIGTLVKLTDARIGKVIAVNSNNLKKPKLAIIVDNMGYKIDKDDIYEFNLAEENLVNIEQSVSASLFNNIHTMDGF